MQLHHLEQLSNPNLCRQSRFHAVVWLTQLVAFYKNNMHNLVMERKSRLFFWHQIAPLAQTLHTSSANAARPHVLPLYRPLERPPGALLSHNLLPIKTDMSTQHIHSNQAGRCLLRPFTPWHLAKSFYVANIDGQVLPMRLACSTPPPHSLQKGNQSVREAFASQH